MNNDSFRDTVDARFASLKADRNSSYKVLNNIAEIEHKANNNAGTEKRKVRRPLVLLVAVILCFTMSFSVLGATVSEVNQFIALFSPELADLLGNHLTEDALETLPAIEGVVCVSDGFELQVVSAIRTADKAMVIITVNDLEKRNLFHYPDFFTFQVQSDNGMSLDEGYLENSDANTGIVTLILTDLNPDDTIKLTLDSFAISGFATDDVDSYFSESLSDGVWSFSFEAEYQQSTTMYCNADAFGEEKSPVTVSQVTIAPFYVSVTASGDIWGNNDIYLLLDDGSVVWMTWDSAHGDLYGYPQDDGTVLTGFEDSDVLLVEGGKSIGNGYCMANDDGLLEHIQLITSTTEAWEVADSIYQSHHDLLDISRIKAIVINGEQYDF
jgi:hypothetical protein